MIHIGNENSFTYRVKLIQYFDCAQTANPGPDDLISYTIFRKSGWSSHKKWNYVYNKSGICSIY